MKVLDKHITELYKFTREHFVEYYDVQTELVDHLANDIEEIWRTNPQLTFKEARTASFKKFGVFGFMEVVEEKQKAMNKRYLKILWRFVKEWFTLPKIIITGLIFMLFFSVFQIPFAEEVILVTLFSLLFLDFYFLFKNRHHRKQKKEKVYLLESMIGDTRNGLSVIMIINIFNLINLSDINFVELAIFWQLTITFVSTLICLVFFIIAFVIPSKAEELLAETYPEYKYL